MEIEAMEVPGLSPKVKAEKRLSQEDRILNLLLDRGKLGAGSEELNKIAFRYSAIIFNLRHRGGWVIETLPRTGTELARFVLKGHQPVSQLELLR
jgi:hypothetical protein